MYKLYIRHNTVSEGQLLTDRQCTLFNAVTSYKHIHHAYANKENYNITGVIYNARAGR